MWSVLEWIGNSLVRSAARVGSAAQCLLNREFCSDASTSSHMICLQRQKLPDGAQMLQLEECH